MGAVRKYCFLCPGADDERIVVVRMDPQLQEVVKQIADAVDKRLAKRIDDAGGRLATQFADAEGRLAKQLADAEGRLAKQFANAEGRLAKQFADAEGRLAEGAKAHMEDLRTLVKVSAEGYGATLEKIERELVALNTKVDTKFTDHAKILRQHTVEINALKRQQARRRSPRS